MRIKHSKYKNTGLIFELLVKQIASDTLNKKDSKAVEILKQYFTGRSALVREFKLYEFVLKNKTVSLLSDLDKVEADYKDVLKELRNRNIIK